MHEPEARAEDRTPRRQIVLSSYFVVRTAFRGLGISVLRLRRLLVDAFTLSL